MFGDYTISQAAKVLDVTDEIVLGVINTIPTRRRFLLFGPIRLNKKFVDGMVPAIHAFNKRKGISRAYFEETLQRLHQSIEQGVRETTKLLGMLNTIGEASQELREDNNSK